MVPTSLPELPKPSRTSGKNTKSCVLEPDVLYMKHIKQKPLLSIFIPLKGHDLAADLGQTVLGKKEQEVFRP